MNRIAIVSPTVATIGDGRREAAAVDREPAERVVADPDDVLADAVLAS